MSESNVPAGLAPDSVSEYLKQVRVVHRQLGISPSCCHGRIYLQNEAVVYCGPDLYGRHLYLDKEAADAWLGLQARARMNRVTIVAVSGFRTLHYQYEIIKKKLQRGESLSQILKVNAAPGFSQHHTGLALDVADENNRSHPLTEEFERSRAFRWLTDHASHFGFSLQYPRNNPDGYVYEPWHWALSKVSSFAMYPGAIAVEMETQGMEIFEQGPVSLLRIVGSVWDNLDSHWSSKHAFESADQLRNELHHKQVEPLHLLAASLRQTRPEVDLLNKFGIIAEGVLAKLRGEQQIESAF